MALEVSQAVAIPAANAGEQDEADEREQRKVRDVRLGAMGDDEGGEERAEGAAGVAPDLKERLSETVASARGQASHPRRFGVKDRGAEADERGGDQHQREGVRDGEQDDAAESEHHAGGEGERLRVAVGVEADERLQDRGRELERQRDEPDLCEGDVQFILEDRIQRREERLNRVVEQVGAAHGDDNGQDGGRCRAGRRRREETAGGR